MKVFGSGFMESLQSPSRLVFLTGVCILTAISGPFGTFELFSFPVRILYWTFIVFLAYGMVFTFRNFFANLGFTDKKRSISVLSFIALSVTLTPIIILVTNPLIADSFTGYRPDWRLVFIVFTMGILVDTFRHIFSNAVSIKAPDQAPKVASRLVSRIPIELGAEILSLRGKDHHVQVRTHKGTACIRLRLVDAINEMDGVDGLCVHRSHWVASWAVVGSEMDAAGKKNQLVLIDGTRIPISRKYEPDVRLRGML